jgi:hypothetical protein
MTIRSMPITLWSKSSWFVLHTVTPRETTWPTQLEASSSIVIQSHIKPMELQVLYVTQDINSSVILELQLTKREGFITCYLSNKYSII